MKPSDTLPVDTSTLEDVVERLARARAEIAKVVVGQDEVVEQLVVALVAGGHALVEGAPGLGKTLLVRTIGTVFGLSSSRIQFTPDLMPADITGTNVLRPTGDGVGAMKAIFEPGPVFAQLVLADEINRATPKTQSALLEAMQERTVTVAGVERTLPSPFFVMATQNPIEMEGTYVLPEAQVDRFFFKVNVLLPTEDVLDEVLQITTGDRPAEPVPCFVAEDVVRLHALTRSVPVASHVRRFVARFVISTHPDRTRVDDVREHVRFGVSPRGAQAWLLAAKAHALVGGRYAVDFSDLAATLRPALRHRLQLGFDAHGSGRSSDDLLEDLYHLEVSSRS